MPKRFTVVWQGLDEPRMEIARVEIDGTSLRATGTQIGRDYELRYALDGATLTTEVVGGAERTFALEGADFFDLSYSPLFNSLPVLRDGLLLAGHPAQDYVMRWVAVPELTVEASQQRYSPVGVGRIAFDADSFHADLTFDEHGLVETYEGLATRLSLTPA
jgi:hypothetical protein